MEQTAAINAALTANILGATKTVGIAIIHAKVAGEEANAISSALAYQQQDAVGVQGQI